MRAIRANVVKKESENLTGKLKTHRISDPENGVSSSTLNKEMFLSNRRSCQKTRQVRKIKGASGVRQRLNRPVVKTQRMGGFGQH